ncbi:MAG: TonB-dependent receptor plug domain-containing protein [Cyclobacteriaceae bacterium]
MKKALTIISLLVCSLYSNAQNHTVSGVVHGMEVFPLMGVEIEIQSNNQIVYTDSKGKFQLTCNEKDKLKFKARGFQNRKVKISKDIKTVAVNMSKKSGQNSRVYGTGYGYVSERDKTSTLANRDTETSDFRKYRTVNAVLIEMGAQIGNGEIILRGTNSLTSSSAALIVINGVISDYRTMSTLKPFDLKRVDILQDAAASVYGSRGSNGVILIETLGVR